MENLWWLYIVEIIPQISLFFGVVSAVGTLLFGIISVAAWIDDLDFKKPVTWLLVSCILIGFLRTLLPSKEGLYTIINGADITEVAKADAEKRMAYKSLKIIGACIDQNLPTFPKKETK